MFKPSSWNELPIELLEKVFELVEATSSRKEFGKFLYQILFVCESWSNAAKYKLYSNVDLSLDTVPDFVYTLRTKPTIGSIVRSVKIRLDVVNDETVFSPDLDHYLERILTYSPYLEAFGSSSNDFEPLVTWRLLGITKKANLKCIKRIALMENCIPTSNQYTSLCFKCIDSLTELRLCPDQSLNNCHELKERINEFKSLTKLQLWGNSVAQRPIITEVDSLINSYPDKAPLLELRRCKFSRDHDYTGKMKPNSSVKKLQLTDCRLSGSTLQYLATKLEALETFVLTTEDHTFAETTAKDVIIQCWNGLVDICQGVSHYDISIKDLDPITYLHQIRGFVILSNALAQHTAEIPTELTMILDRRDTAKTYGIEVKKNGSFVRFFESCNRDSGAFMECVHLNEVFKALKPCFSLDIIRVLDASSDLEPECILEYLKTVSKESNVEWAQKSQKKFWGMFNGVMSLVDGKTGSVVHLDKMVFPRRGLGKQMTSMETSISELKLTNCVFHYNVLLKMSPRLPTVGKLIISRCIFMSNSIYQINIDLPETRVGCLELNLNSIFDSRSIVPPKCHTVAVTIGDVTKNYVYNVGDEHQKTYQKTDEGPVGLPRGPADFHISIKCKKLQSLSISFVSVF
ncbi:hypothetical protein BD408DRAFT_434172 [Parasitella parasitica]|nr:hypothetical protein BD408DRAFT_434172 [Parasitella parasitica]